MIDEDDDDIRSTFFEIYHKQDELVIFDISWLLTTHTNITVVSFDCFDSFKLIFFIRNMHGQKCVICK